MAVIQYSALLTQMRGKLGGSQFNKTFNGYSLQKKVSQPRRDTPGQAAQRQRMQLVQRMWKEESTQRQAQASQVAASNPTFDRFGQQVVLSGYQQYVKTQIRRLLSGVSLSTAFVTTSLNPQSNSLTGVSLSLNGYNQDGYPILNLQAQRDNTGTPTPSDAAPRLHIYVRPVNPNGNPMRGSRWALLSATAASNDSPYNTVQTVFLKYNFSVGTWVQVRTDVVHMGAGIVTGSTMVTVQVT